MRKMFFTQPKSSTLLSTAQTRKPAYAFLFLLLAFFSLPAWSQDVLVGLTSNGGPEGKGTMFSIKTNATSFSIIKGFVDWGSYPVSDLVRGSDGNLYGMVPEGGTYGHGTIFKMTSSGVITVLKNLNMSVDGGYPKGSLIQAKDGNFYGMLSTGSVNNGGAIFKITSAGVYTIVRSFSINTDGGRPQGRLVQGTDGNFYGMNSSGGAYGYGTIFKLTPAGQYTVLKSFNTADGTNPYGSLMQASDGALYGMTRYGGTYKYGTIFRITTSGTYTVLRHLNSTTDGAYPMGDLIQGKDGMLYGMTPNGGASYNGTVFKMNLTGSSFTVLKAMSASTYGGNAQGRLLQASDGNFYGTCYSMSGGFSGSVFKMTPAGAMTVIKKLTNDTEGGYPSGSLIQTPDGMLYGTANSGGKGGKGTIFKLTTAGAITILAHLNGGIQGNAPQDKLALGKDSAYYGVTQYGGTYNYGTIFKICGGTTTVLRSFNRNTDGGNPAGGLVRANDGNFYGMTETGGTNGGGTIYRVTPTGTFTVLRHLKGTTDGDSPKGTLAVGPDGALYGMTYSGGTGTGGTIFKITTAGAFTVLRHLVPSTDGNGSEAGLVLGKDGIFYGMTGTNTRFFKITTAGAFTVLRTLATSADGYNPGSSLIQATDGNFYGTLSGGGTYNGGVIFKITPTGTLTKLRHLNPTTDGGHSKSGLVQGTDGNFYGTTSTGGTYKAGTIFKISSTGTFSILRHLDMAKDGGTSLSALILAPVNKLVANAQTGLTTNEDVAKAITLAGSGGTALTFQIVTQPKNGTVSTGTGASRTYTPKANYSGKDSFAFTTTVGCMASAPAWVKITVNPVNDAPVLATIGNKTVVKGSALTFTATATDPDAGQTKTFSLVSPPTGAAINSSTGAFSWKPAATGTFTVKVRVTDNGSPVLYDEETITVTVTATATATTLASAERNAAPLKQAIAGTEPATKALLYPNPVSSQFAVQLSEAVAQATITIWDSKGSLVSVRKLAATGEGKFLVDATALKPGSYVVQVQGESGREILKFIKM